jgi:hypothetical protein|tara:strand:- start:459 stop:1061 length:603 start_codon:yes stop_codon:yes gene_type:complete
MHNALSYVGLGGQNPRAGNGGLPHEKKMPAKDGLLGVSATAAFGAAASSATAAALANAAIEATPVSRSQPISGAPTLDAPLPSPGLEQRLRGDNKLPSEANATPRLLAPSPPSPPDVQYTEPARGRNGHHLSDGAVIGLAATVAVMVVLAIFAAVACWRGIRGRAALKRQRPARVSEVHVAPGALEDAHQASSYCFNANN